jgi:hypothetical protein
MDVKVLKPRALANPLHSTWRFVFSSKTFIGTTNLFDERSNGARSNGARSNGARSNGANDLDRFID